jgi:prophage DNA circulation protein
MAWRDQLRQASFRGVNFFVDISQFTTGRRVTLHEFPDRDLPFAEDMGRVGRSFKVEGHILGDDYFETKRLLIEASEKFGPGELIHPYFGTLQVQCSAVSIDEDTREGGIAKISFQFYEAGDNRFPTVIDDKGAAVVEKSEVVKETSKSAFDRIFSVSKLPGFAVDSARKKVAEFADRFAEATKDVRTNADEIANLAFNIRNLRAETDTLLQSPSVLSQRLRDSLSLLEDAVGVSRGKFQAYSAFFNFGETDEPILVSTPTRLKEIENRDVFNQFIRQTVIASSAAVTTEIEYESINEATNARAQVRDLIENELFITKDDDVFQSLKDLNAQVTRLLPDVDSDLPNVQTIVPENTTSSLILAYDLFENPNVEPDLVLRNNIPHPGFIVGGSQLEVIDVGTGA